MTVTLTATTPVPDRGTMTPNGHLDRNVVNRDLGVSNQANCSQKSLIADAASTGWVSKTMWGALSVRTSQYGRNDAISSRYFLETSRSKRACRQSIGQLTARSRSRLSMRRTSDALVLMNSGGSVAST